MWVGLSSRVGQALTEVACCLMSVLYFNFEAKKEYMENTQERRRNEISGVKPEDELR